MLGLNPHLLELSDRNDIAFYLKDSTGRYAFINESGARLVGHTPSEVIGYDDFAIFKKPSAEFIVRKDRAISYCKDPVFFDEVTQSNAGWKRFHAAKIRVPCISGHGYGVLGIAADISKGRDSRIPELVHFLADCYAAKSHLSLPSGFAR